MKLILQTDRLLIRPFTPADLDDFFRLVSDPDVTRYTGDRGTTIEEVKQGLEERVFGDYRKYGFGRWATVLKENGQLIGFAGLKYLPELNEVDLGYRFFKEYWGRGLATEASLAIVRYGFEQLGLQQIIGITQVENTASGKVLEKLGFKLQRTEPYQGSLTAWYVLQKRAVI